MSRQPTSFFILVTLGVSRRGIPSNLRNISVPPERLDTGVAYVKPAHRLRNVLAFEFEQETFECRFEEAFDVMVLNAQRLGAPGIVKMDETRTTHTHGKHGIQNVGIFLVPSTALVAK